MDASINMLSLYAQYMCLHMHPSYWKIKLVSVHTGTQLPFKGQEGNRMLLHVVKIDFAESSIMNMLNNDLETIKDSLFLISSLFIIW